MINIRKSEERGHFNFGWLDTNHTFSFGEYYDVNHMRWKHLRVLNEDVIAAKGGFPLHPHRDMEIFSFVARGALAHKDSLGSESSIHPGKVQLMSAGRGVRHSEFNPSSDFDTHLFQVWIEPESKGNEPMYQELEYDERKLNDSLYLLASPEGEDGAMLIRQKAQIYVGHLNRGSSLDLPIVNAESGWLQIVSGNMKLQGQALEAGDGAGIENEAVLSLKAESDSVFLWFRMA